MRVHGRTKKFRAPVFNHLSLRVKSDVNLRMILSNREEGFGLTLGREAIFIRGARMPEQTIEERMAPPSCRDCERWQEIKNKIHIAELLTKAIEGLGDRVKSNDFKLTLGDYLKLLQLEKEMEEQAPKEIKVTWVEPPGTSEPEK